MSRLGVAVGVAGSYKGSGSIKVRHTTRTVTIRATGAAAHTLATAVRSALEGAPGVPYLTVRFADHGQDVLEWDIDADKLVTDSRPYQARVWIGTQVLGAVRPGQPLVFMHPHDGIAHQCQYAVAEVIEGWK